MDNLRVNINSPDFAKNFIKPDNTYEIRNHKPFAEQIVKDE